jgi:glutamine cyclotransferase
MRWRASEKMVSSFVKSKIVGILCPVVLLLLLFVNDLQAQAPIHKIKILKTVKRSPVYTQGLFFHEGTLYESIGLYNSSRLASFKIERGFLKEEKSLKFPNQYFAEGSVFAGGFIQVLTWKEGTLFKVNKDTFEIKESVFYQGEGWGLTTNGNKLFVSDGTDTLKMKDPHTFKEISDPIKVMDGERAISNLNELEYDFKENAILANVYQSDMVCAIEPSTGKVLYYLDLFPLRREAIKNTRGGDPAPDVTNGIAIDESGKMYATGKFFGLIFEIEVVKE